MTAKPCEDPSPEECGSSHESLDDKRYAAYLGLGWGLWPWVLRAPWKYRLHWDGFPDADDRELRRSLHADAPRGTIHQRIMRRVGPYLPFHVCQRLRVCFNHWLGNYGLHPMRDPVDGKWFYVSTQRYHGRFYAAGLVVGDAGGADAYVGQTARYDVLPLALRERRATEEESG